VVAPVEEGVVGGLEEVAAVADEDGELEVVLVL